MLPDLGEHLFRLMGPDKRVVLLNCEPVTLAEAPGGTIDICFTIALGDDLLTGRYCGTVNTRQAKAKLIRILTDAAARARLEGRATIHGTGYVRIDGKLSLEAVTGASGEHYRLILGRVARMPG